MMEWGPSATPDQQLDSMLSQELTVGQLISLSPFTPALSDDRPVNEYMFLRTPCRQCPFGSDRLRSIVYSKLVQLSNGGMATNP